MNIITIDTGTTNTRVYLWKDDLCLDKEMRSIGVKNTGIDGNNKKIVSAIASAYSTLLDRNNIQDSEVDLILASGMITSNLGLVEIPHLVAPVGIDEFSRSIQSRKFEEISNANPIHFIPGVKNTESFDFSNLHRNDFMRGEEVEVLGLIQQTNIDGNAVIALPGSHSKYIELDGDGRISSCFTTLAGEMLEVITTNTILASSLKKSFCSEINEDTLLNGYRMSLELGLTRTLFTVRPLDIQANEDINALASFTLGAVIASDIQALIALYGQEVKNIIFVVAGNGVFSDALYYCLKDEFKNTSVKRHRFDSDNPLAALGAIAVAKQAGLLRAT